MRVRLTRRNYLKLLTYFGISIGTIEALKTMGLLQKLEFVSSSEVLDEARAGAEVMYAMGIDLERCVGCNACVIACNHRNEVPEEKWRTVVREVTKGGEKYFLPIVCMQCENPPCVTVCPTGASYRDPENGIVRLKGERCIGCKACMSACPYYISEDGPIRFFNPKTFVVDKCDFCYESLLSKGYDKPACVVACPAYARLFGDLTDPASEISIELARRPVVFRLKEELGTEPKVYYLGRAPE